MERNCYAKTPFSRPRVATKRVPLPEIIVDPADIVALKRKSNTMAARRSRAHAKQRLDGLLGENESLTKERDYWKLFAQQKVYKYEEQEDWEVYQLAARNILGLEGGDRGDLNDIQEEEGTGLELSNISTVVNTYGKAMNGYTTTSNQHARRSSSLGADRAAQGLGQDFGQSLRAPLRHHVAADTSGKGNTAMAYGPSPGPENHLAHNDSSPTNDFEVTASHLLGESLSTTYEAANGFENSFAPLGSPHSAVLGRVRSNSRRGSHSQLASRHPARLETANGLGPARSVARHAYKYHPYSALPRPHPLGVIPQAPIHSCCFCNAIGSTTLTNSIRTCDVCGHVCADDCETGIPGSGSGSGLGNAA